MSLSDGVFAAIIGAVVALMTEAIIKPFWDKVARKSEEQRWYLNHFLPQKFATLHSLYAATVRVYYDLDEWRGLAQVVETRPKRAALAEDYLKKMGEKFHENVGLGSGPFHQALSLAWIYLDEPTRKVMRDFSEEVLTVQLQITVRLQRDEFNMNRLPETFDLEELKRRYETAQAQMEQVLHPTDIIKRISP